MFHLEFLLSYSYLSPSGGLYLKTVALYEQTQERRYRIKILL